MQKFKKNIVKDKYGGSCKQESSFIDSCFIFYGTHLNRTNKL